MSGGNEIDFQIQFCLQKDSLYEVYSDYGKKEIVITKEPSNRGLKASNRFRDVEIIMNSSLLVNCRGRTFNTTYEELQDPYRNAWKNAGPITP